MGTRAQQHASSAGNAAPDLYQADPVALSKHLHALADRGGLSAVITFVVAFIARLWKRLFEAHRQLAIHSRKKPPSERYSALQLWLPGVYQDAPANDTSKPKDKPTRRPRSGKSKGRGSLPAHLPRVDEYIELPEEQRICSCGCSMKFKDYEVTESLERVKMPFWVLRKNYETWSCRDCKRVVRRAERDDEVVFRGILGPGLVSDALVDHVDDAVPFERMERNARDLGVTLNATTLAQSAIVLAEKLDPIVNHIKARALASETLALDATSMKVLDRKHPNGIRTAVLWCFVGDSRYRYFAYAEDLTGAALQKVVGVRCLHLLLADGGTNINALESQSEGRAGCHAHARRYLVAALRTGDTRAVPAIEIYLELFRIESESKLRNETRAERQLRRAKESEKWVSKLRQWVDERLVDVEPRSALGRAVKYLHRQWKRLTVFLRDGRAELTNNEVERALRRWVLARKTWLFVGHERSAKAMCNAMTVVQTARAFGHDPRAYIFDVTQRLLAGEKDLRTMLPEHWVAPPEWKPRGTRHSDAPALK